MTKFLRRQTLKIQSRIWKTIFPCVLSLCVGGTLALAQDLPHYAKDIHLGVASCATSFCHGSAKELQDNNVSQNEYSTWLKGGDAHSKAYSILLGPEGKKIARNYFGNSKQSAHTAAECLDCHADNVAPSKRGEKFQISDGVGCEGCHGGSERWIRGHFGSKSSHQDNVTRGLFPTEDPANRAQLCLSCHMGTPQKFVNHRMMGAGHPRLRFELDLFTAIQPAHFTVDDDYKKRKKVANGVKTWATGQLIAVSQYLALVSDPKTFNDGAFPELVFFECHACHHPLEKKRWRARSGAPIAPGSVHLNDANLIMLRVVAGLISDQERAEIFNKTRNLHRAVQRGGERIQTAARALKSAADDLLPKLIATQFDRSKMRGIFIGIVNEGLANEYVDFAAAEQATMALESIFTAIKTAKYADENEIRGIEAGLKNCYKVVDPVLKEGANFSPDRFKVALRSLKKTVGGPNR